MSALAAAAAANNNNYGIDEKLELSRLGADGSLREMDGVITISSAKPGNGVEQLRDNNLETYWQSDGFAPHVVNIQFPKKVALTKLCLYIDFNLDESYTPKKISIRCGTSLHDLLELKSIELQDPCGWVTIPLTSVDSIPVQAADGDTDSSSSPPLLTHLLQVRVHSMHQNGRDTHIRQLKILGPRASAPAMGGLTFDDFQTTEMSQFASLR